MSEEKISSLEGSQGWFVEAAGARSLGMTADGIIVEKGSAGVYADVPDETVGKVLETLASKPWREAIAELYEKDNPWLCRIVTDPSRSMPLEVLGVPKDGVCLDVGSGWGQLCIPLVQWGCKVVALDLTLDRLRILRSIARQEGAGLTLVKGNVLSFPFREGTFDLVLFNGTLEWVGTGRSADRTIRQCQVEALKNAGRALKTGGMIYVGIENSLGLKYLMGARDDHSGLANYSFRSENQAEKVMKALGGDRPTTKTWGLNQLTKLAEESGLKVKSVFGCFPDYKLPRHLVPVDEVNAFLLKGEMDWDEHHGDNGEPIKDQDAIRAAYREMAENGIAQWICPSYVMLLVKP